MPKPHRSFDPRRVGALECAAWVAYYRRRWFSLLRSSLALTRHMFGLTWTSTVYGAWLVMRANQFWARFPNNDPDRARREMERFYRLVARRHGESLHPATAAALEVNWWKVHRQRQHGQSQEQELIDALADLYSYVYGVAQTDVRLAAQQRALAMRHSDRWVQLGCDPDDRLIGEERAALVRSYAGLLAAVHRP